MLQNRVDPQGNIIYTKARGAWMGNRGLIHNEHQQITRPYRLKAWITCLLEFKGWHRVVMTPNRYTELFFLDEATAFASGHRPCAECRRKNFDLFKAAWLAGNPEFGFDKKTSISMIDEILHSERIDHDDKKVVHEWNVKDLPDGAFVLYNDVPFLLAGGLFHEWSPFGYKEGIKLPLLKTITVLTPPSIINAFRAGYRPQMGL